eukprot:2176201-Prymnesium_polylepis.1
MGCGRAMVGEEGECIGLPVRTMGGGGDGWIQCRGSGCEYCVPLYEQPVIEEKSLALVLAVVGRRCS